MLARIKSLRFLPIAYQVVQTLYADRTFMPLVGVHPLVVRGEKFAAGMRAILLLILYLPRPASRVLPY